MRGIKGVTPVLADDCVIDPWRALVRHADMTAAVETSPRPPVPPFRRPRNPALAPDRLTADERAQYQLELDERAAFMEADGMPAAAALDAARAALGCVEFLAYCQLSETERASVPVVSQQRARADIAPDDLRAEVRSWVQLAAAMESAA
jgi:hypothetical protein